jgi:hypothetical protein
MATHESRALLLTITVQAFIAFATTMPSADFCRPVRFDHSTLSPDSETNGRSPEVSSTAFRTQPADLQPVPLMDMGFAIIRPLARHRMPLIRFLYIGSYVCSALLSGPASRRRRCASLSLHLHQVVKGTFTPKLSNMLGTPNKGTASRPPTIPTFFLPLSTPNTRMDRRRWWTPVPQKRFYRGRTATQSRSSPWRGQSRYRRLDYCIPRCRSSAKWRRWRW